MSRPYLVSYDVTNKKRLSRLHRALKKQAVSIQYSVFMAMFTPAQFEKCARVISLIIDQRTDDVRIYSLSPGSQQRRLGRSTLPAGVEFTPLPLAFREPKLLSRGRQKSIGAELSASDRGAGPHKESGQQDRRIELIRGSQRFQARVPTGLRSGLLYIR
jgi:CRISPR-associated protein Cas2